MTMALAGDKALASRPDLFELAPDPVRARSYRRVAIVLPLAPLVLGIKGLIDGETGRGIMWLVVAVGLVYVCLALANSSRQWVRRGQVPLRTSKVMIDDDPQEAYQRLATRDAAQYTPMKVTAQHSESREQWIEFFWPEKERITYVVVVERAQQTKQPPTIVEFRDQQHDDFHAAVEAGLDRPYDGDTRPVP